MAEINNDKIVPLPCAVEDLIAKICREQNRRPLETNTRLILASLGEEVALNILWRISGQEIRKSFDGFVLHLAKQFSPNINASSSSPNIHSSLSPSPQQPQNRSPITSTRLLMNSQSDSGAQSPISLKLEGSSTMDSQRQRGSESTTSQHLVALGELEFRKAFLILSYLGGKNLEEVVSADQIRGYKDLPMRTFESKIWEAFILL